MQQRTIRARRLGPQGERLLDPSADEWTGCERHEITMMPAPLPLVREVSPYLATSQRYGQTRELAARVAHDGETLSVRLSWRDASKEDRISDLDRFVDGGAIVFPLVAGANPVTMGDAEKPVNAWLWKADRAEPFDVIARGYSTTQRRPAADSGLRARAHHEDGMWRLVLQRPLVAPTSDYVRFQAGESSGIAFAIWQGSNAERSAQKAFSGDFIGLELDT